MEIPLLVSAAPEAASAELAFVNLVVAEKKKGGRLGYGLESPGACAALTPREQWLG